MFDGTLGTWKDTKYNIELKENVKPYHGRPYSIPQAYEKQLRYEVERLVKIGVLRKVNRSKWGAPNFVMPKKDRTIRFITNFRELNKQIKRKPYQSPTLIIKKKNSLFEFEYGDFKLENYKHYPHIKAKIAI